MDKFGPGWSFYTHNMHPISQQGKGMAAWEGRTENSSEV